jgi:hypothetical protein
MQGFDEPSPAPDDLHLRSLRPPSKEEPCLRLSFGCSSRQPARLPWPHASESGSAQVSEPTSRQEKGAGAGRAAAPTPPPRLPRPQTSQPTRSQPPPTVPM